ncbi:alpha-mannosidase/mannosylglycerate hydrolase [Paenibacillus taihuensis]|uniref:Alpha-mannosidase/mannosylglycerate hydrolase n=1 Tax=Paenibacillus taihuensis TaxID=1156355 RepID=A0A3D9RH91_9BACL|nr:glycosyl hydrolase-related protein [Paenibacillus taihuensis]REE77701.1 alpha-mannosidase/mannosylglycerate hydrolase [Paenibacillus taihuensis]
MKPSFHVISHTHWDREWYLTFEQFRFRLVDLINGLIELLESDPEFEVFHLDGQTIVLEDYFEIHPENKERLEKLIREGRILIGPWYLQNDEYLTSGEATIRNLQTGITMSRQIDKEMKVGYLPDQFGNISQIPQILRGFGIGNVVFGRGYDNFKSHQEQEFLWEGADDSRITAIFMPNWYNNAQRIPEDPAKALKTLKLIQAKIDERKQTNNYLLMNGVDHLEAQENLSGILKGLRETLGDEVEILHTTLEEHIRRVEAELLSPAVQKGEMRAGDDYHILAGTLSARVYLKQENVKAQDLLEKWIEPLAVWARMSGLGSYPEAYLTYLWKSLMKNHPHDSICGCSQDEVHEHMMDRFEALMEAGEETLRRQALSLLRGINQEGMGDDDQLIAVFNPSTLPLSGWIEQCIDFLEKDSVQSFRIFNAKGEEVPYQIISQTKTRKQRLSPINLPTELPVDRYTIGFAAEQVPGQGYTSYQVIPSQLPAAFEAPQNEESKLENEFLRVTVNPNGSLNLFDKITGETYEQQLIFVDDADAGDLYVFKYLHGDKSLTSAELRAQVQATVTTEGYQAVEIGWQWELPASLATGGASRSEDKVGYPIKAMLGLLRHARHLDVRIELDNAAKDHRLRVRFPIANAVPGTLAGGQFDVLRREASSGKEYVRNANSQPNWKWAAAGWEQGMAVYNKGLHEYELTEADTALDLTLIRSVGTIFGRPNPLPHENDDNPLGQCQGIYTFELALRPFGASDNAAILAREAEAYHHGLRSYVVPVREDKWASGRPWVQDSEIGDLFSRPDPDAGKPRLPREASFVMLQGDGAVLSAVKKRLGGSEIAVRFYNALDVPTSACLTLAAGISRAWKADLMEQPTEELQTENNTVTVQVKPKEIMTILVQTG